LSNVALVDVRHLDGEPWDVAQQAGKQVDACFELLEEALEGLYWSARGAWLSQEDYREGQMPSGADFAESALGRKLEAAQDNLKVAEKQARMAALAASHDPRSV
jgi:hypothetical protein